MKSIPVLVNHDPQRIIGRAEMQPDGSLLVELRDWMPIGSMQGAFQQLVPVEGRQQTDGRIEVKSFKVYAFSVGNE